MTTTTSQTIQDLLEQVKEKEARRDELDHEIIALYAEIRDLSQQRLPMGAPRRVSGSMPDRILQYLDAAPASGATPKQIAEAINYGDSAIVWRVLSRLRKDGLVQRVKAGAGAKAGWVKAR